MGPLVVVFEGDSLTAGYSAATDLDFGIAPPSLSFAVANPNVIVYNVATGGQSVDSDMIPNAATQVDAKYDATKPANIAVLWGGTNDMVNEGRSAAQAYADISTWCTARRAAGFKVVVCNTIKRIDLNETKRTTLNASLASNHSFADALVDLSALLVDRTTNPTLWQSDDTHITAAGGVVVATAIEAAIRSVTAVSGAPGAFPLAVSANARYFQTPATTPMLLNGSSAWGLISGRTLAQAKTYIDKRTSEGFNNFIVCLVVANDTVPPNTETWNNTVDAFLTPGNYSTPNSAYFDHADDVLDYLLLKGCFVWLVPVYLGWYGSDSSGSWDLMEADTSAHLATYGTYCGNRYGHRLNVGWCLGGDQYPEKYHTTAAVREHALAVALKAAAPRQLYTAHLGTDTDQLTWYGTHSYDAPEYRTYFAPPYGANGHYAFAEPATTLNPYIYTRDRDAHNGLDLAGGAIPTMPHFHLDESYEGEPNGTAVELRRRQHRGMCEGMCGGSFNAGSIWYTSFNTATTTTGMTQNSYWWLFWSVLPWHTMVPDITNAFVTTGRGTYGTNTYVCATASSVCLAAYFPDAAARTITVAMTQFSKSMRARWYDPTAGTYTLISSSLANTGTQNFTQPGNNSSGSTTDWLLLLD